MTLKIGLTGSIGMGKSTTGEFFKDAGLPVWDADAAVHELYQPKKAGAEAISHICPDAVTETGVDRATLRAAIQQNPALLQQIEQTIHPLVAQHRNAFIEAHVTAPAVVFDIPLLFETGAEAWLDHVVVVTAPGDVQRARVLARPGMTESSFNAILQKQLPDAEKRLRADSLIDTSQGLESARAQVTEILVKLGIKPDA
ncbi:MAG: dephospho-CoA kinase [Pseudomonadota bacterium]